MFVTFYLMWDLVESFLSNKSSYVLINAIFWISKSTDMIDIQSQDLGLRNFNGILNLKINITSPT